MQQQEQFDQWAVIELMGRQRIAGKVTEKTVAGAGFLHVQVPATDKQPEFSRLISPSSIYAINPVTEDVARLMAGRINEAPIAAWDISEFMKRVDQKAIVASPGYGSDYEKEEEEEEFDDQD